MNILIWLALATFVSTLVGGLFAIKFKKGLPYFFAFSAGSLIAICFLDLLPEALKIGESANFQSHWVFGVVVASFLFYSFLERFFLTHHHHDDEGHGHIFGPIAAGSLVVHSFFDGIAIGAAYQVNAAVGLIVALAVLTHDFTDGINTVTLMLKNKHKVGKAIFFLFLDAIAPVLGIIIASSLIVNEMTLSIILAFFVGEFLYIGATNLLPETYKHDGWIMAICMLLGALLIFILTSLVG